MGPTKTPYSIETYLMRYEELLREYTWVIQAAVLCALTILAYWLVRRTLLRLEKRFEDTTRTPWDEAVVRALKRPVGLLVWLVGLTMVGQMVRAGIEAPILDSIESIRDLGVIALFGWFLLSMVEQGQLAFTRNRELTEKPVDRGLVETISKLLRILVFITTVLVAMQTMGYSISGLLAFGGIGGIAIGFAAKDMLSNFFGGLMIFLDRPFHVGDWIRSPDKEIEGTVEHISWRLTRIRTFDKRPLYVPNATFSSITVENPSRMTHRRIYETIGIRYQDAHKLQAIVRDVKKMLSNHEAIDDSQTMIVNFNRFGPSSLDFFVYTFTHTTNWVEYHEIKQDILLRIYEVVTRHGADVAFPTSTLHIIPEGVPEEGGAPPTPTGK